MVLQIYIRFKAVQSAQYLCTAIYVQVKDLMVGDDASKLRSMLECKYPMENGIVRSWEDMQHVWVSIVRQPFFSRFFHTFKLLIN